MTTPPEQQAQPIAISASNCESMVGASWKWVTRFAREHGVPTWRVGGRRFVAAAPLAAAMQQAASSALTRTQADRVALMKAEIARELRGLTR